jgi:hypothetical protein
LASNRLMLFERYLVGAKPCRLKTGINQSIPESK